LEGRPGLLQGQFRHQVQDARKPTLGRCYLTDLGAAHLIGFFAGGEIARIHLHGYNGVLTVFAGVA
jgi:small ligand-binding sensory domain FIST